MINGVSRDVERIVMHAGYKALPQALLDQAMASGEAMLIVVFLASSDDIALIKLTLSVMDVAPVELYKDSNEPGQIAKIVGKGATDTGVTGHSPNGPNRTELRRAFNTITSAHDRWLCYVFDEPPTALPLEGTLGNGDSGGPVLLQTDDQWLLAGLGSWKVAQGDVRTARPGRYGQTSCNVRLSHYIEWIEGVISEQPQARRGTNERQVENRANEDRHRIAVFLPNEDGHERGQASNSRFPTTNEDRHRIAVFLPNEDGHERGQASNSRFPTEPSERGQASNSRFPGTNGTNEDRHRIAVFLPNEDGHERGQASKAANEDRHRIAVFLPNEDRHRIERRTRTYRTHERGQASNSRFPTERGQASNSRFPTGQRGQASISRFPTRTRAVL
jgi:hypothetical protein